MKCSICQRESENESFFEKHHLIPKSKKGKMVIVVCHSCGDQLHLMFTNNELKKNLNTLEKISSNEKMKNWINWISTKPIEKTICMRRKK